MMNVDEVIRAARFHVADNKAMESSARLALADAVKLHNDGDYDAAYVRALASLAYSIGKLAPTYRKAERPVHLTDGAGRAFCGARSSVPLRTTKRNADVTCGKCAKAMNTGPAVLRDLFRF